MPGQNDTQAALARIEAALGTITVRLDGIDSRLAALEAAAVVAGGKLTGLTLDCAEIAKTLGRTQLAAMHAMKAGT